MQQNHAFIKVHNIHVQNDNVVYSYIKYVHARLNGEIQLGQISDHGVTIVSWLRKV